MAGIQVSGLVSGIDTGSIIDQLMSVERQPRTLITLKQDATTKRQSLLQDVGTKLTALKTANDDLKSVLSWLDTQEVDSGDTSKVTAERIAGAPPGGYDVTVDQLATAERQTYAFASPTSDGTLQISNADGTARTSIALSAGATVDDAVSAINGSTDSGLYAVNVNGSLVLSAKTTGDTSGFSLSGAGVGAQTERIAGQNAQFEINGTTYTRQSNTFSDAIPGVQMTLKGKTAVGASVGVTVGTPAPDKQGIIAKVKAFVTAYNDLVTTTRGDLTDQPVVNAATTADVQKGTLFGDSGLSDMLSQFRSVISAPVAGLTGLTSLADIGVTTGAANTSGTINQDSVDGKLTVDTDKLGAALDSNPNGVRALLGGLGGTDGFAQAFNTVVSPYQGSDGLIAQRVTSAASDLTDIANKLTDFDARMDAKQTLLQKQFTAMETAMQASQAAGSSIAGMVAQSG